MKKSIEKAYYRLAKMAIKYSKMPESEGAFDLQKKIDELSYKTGICVTYGEDYIAVEDEVFYFM